MSAVTVTGGPFTDGQGNFLPGEWQFQPDPDIGYDADGMPHEVHGFLLVDEGTLSTTLIEGNYTCVIRTEAFYIEQEITVLLSNGASQTVESLLSAGSENLPANFVIDGGAA